MNVKVIIPARMASSRLPGKPLIDLMGKSMIQRTWERCLLAVPMDMVWVATDHEQIQKHCEDHGMQVIMTSSDCLTGTDRIAEVATKLPADIYINVQGDEPLMNPQDIKDVIEAIHRYPGEIINGYAPILEEEQYASLSIPKVVTRPDGRLLYMSRSPIPGNKSGKFHKAWRQVCVYAYNQASLIAFANYAKKTPLEEEEDLEILRFLEMGYEVRMIPLSTESIAVDTPEDVLKVVAYLEGE